MLLPIPSSVSPCPSWPADLITVLAFLWIGLGAVVGYSLRARAGDITERVGRVRGS